MNVINNDLFYFLYVRRYLLLDGVRRLIVLSFCFQVLLQSSADVWKSRWPSWAPVPNKPTVSLDVKQHSTNSTKFYVRRAVRASRPGHVRIICSGRRRCASGRFGMMMMMKWCIMSSDVSWHIRDKLWPMPKHGSVYLYVHGNQKAR